MSALNQHQEEARFVHAPVRAQSRTAPQSTGVRTADQPCDQFVAISNANKLCCALKQNCRLVFLLIVQQGTK